jgi:antitoxin MazE
MLTKTVKWGHSLALRIPRTIAQECGIGESSEVEILCKNKTIVVTPVAREYSLIELLAQVTPGNIHAETSFGKPTGKETL